MIPRANITAWRAQAPWPTDAQIEQDLVLSRALVQIFSDAPLAQTLAFRGGTALHNRYLEQGGDAVSRAQFEANLTAKIGMAAFREDIAPLLTTGGNFDPIEGAALVQQRLISKLRGAPWKGS